MTKRLFAIVLMAALLLTATPVSAATTPTVTAGSATVTQGSSVSLSVTAANLASLGSMELILYYDSTALSVSSVTAGGLFSTEVFDYNADEAGIIRVNAVSFAGVSGSGTVLTVRFTAASTAPAGTYPITLAVGDCYDVSLSPVTVTATDGSVTVNEKAVNNGSFTLYQYLSASTLKQGDSLTVSVRSPYKYYSSADFLMEYDWELLKLESIELHNDLCIEGAVYSINTAIQGQALITYASTKELSNYYKFTAVFTVIGDVDTTTKISTTAKNVYKADLTAYTPYTVSSTLTLEKTAVVPDYKDLTLETDDLAVGKTGSSRIVLQQGAGVAAGDFTVSYDPTYLRCTGVTAGTELYGGTVMVNPNYTEGTVKFSYINEAGAANEIQLLTLTWEAVTAPNAHYAPTLSGKNVVDADYNAVTLEYGAQEFCFYDAAVTAPTCTTEGYTVYTCSCGESCNADYTSITAHSYVDGLCGTCGRHIYALVIENGTETEYTDLQQAIDNCESGYVKLTSDYTGALTVSKDLYLDLNGYSLGSVQVEEGATLYGMDSANDGYDASLCGSISDLTGSCAPHVKTDVTGSVRRYVTVSNGQGVSFHRLYLGLTHVNLKPGQAALGYKASFYADDVLAACIDAYGYSLCLEGNSPVTQTKEGFTAGTLTLRVQNILAENRTDTQNAAAATANITASVFVTLTVNGQSLTLETAPCTRNLAAVLEALDQNYETLTQAQAAAVKALAEAYAAALTQAGCQFDNLK